MSRSAEQLLEFDKLKEILAGFTTCALGRRAIESLAFREDADALESEFALIREAAEYLRNGAELGFGALADPADWLARVAVPGAPLSSAELLDVASLVETALTVRRTFQTDTAKHPRLSARAAALPDLRPLSAAIRRAVLPNGEISDDASPELKRIRASLVQAREKIQRSLEAILRARGEAAAGDYITLRSDRFVIPVRASERRSVPGVVHGASATGQTVFVEPLDAIDLNNRLVQLAEQELAEIGRILEELTTLVRANQVPLEFAAAGVAHFDSIFARGRFARAFDCTAPEFTPGNQLHLQSARNPVLEATLHPQGRNAVPMSLALGGEAESRDSGTVMVISGPNTGGKTVCLKTTGLAALSAQSAIPVAAERAQMPIFDRVLVDIGDEQSIAASLSTFSAHMLNLKSMLDAATSRSLILVDEMGTGTAPEEGAALAVALLEEFRIRGALTLATTHHDRLKAYATATPGIVNAAMEFDEAQLRPTYRLLTGIPGTSSGIEIARRLGLPERIVDHARASLSPESRESGAMLAWLHRRRDEMDQLETELRRERAQLESERQALQTEWIERQKKRITELDRAFQSAQKNFEAEIARLAADIKDRSLRVQAEKLAVRGIRRAETQARDEANAAVVETLAASQADLGAGAERPPQPVPPEQLSPGRRVLVKGFKQPVVFRKQDGRSADIEAGPLRMRVPMADIIGLEPEEAKRPAAEAARNSGVTLRSNVSAEANSGEINVIGCTVEEASRRVDKFLDEAALAGKPSVRIVHGHGTGALRRGLADFLAAHPLVEQIHAEAEDRGGAAVTVAEIKG